MQPDQPHQTTLSENLLPADVKPCARTSTLQIHATSAAQRCDICHQFTLSEFLDTTHNCCSRCLPVMRQLTPRLALADAQQQISQSSNWYYPRLFGVCFLVFFSNIAWMLWSIAQQVHAVYATAFLLISVLPIVGLTINLLAQKSAHSKSTMSPAASATPASTITSSHNLK